MPVRGRFASHFARVSTPLRSAKVAWSGSGWTQRHKNPLLTDDLAETFGAQQIPAKYRTVSSALSVPLLHGNEVIGVINLAATRTIYEAFNTGRLDLLDAVIARDALEHEEVPPDLQGADALEPVKNYVRLFRTAMPDVIFNVIFYDCRGRPRCPMGYRHRDAQRRVYGGTPSR